MKQYHECELKMKVFDENEEKKIIKNLKKMGHLGGRARLERDFILDNEKNSLKKRRILLRVREIAQDNKKEILFTLKIKGNATDFQDNIEIETFAGNKDEHTIKQILEFIEKEINVHISSSIFKMNEIADILKELRKIGIYSYNVVEKKRTEYIGEKTKASLDVFPVPVGTYLEIEAESKEDLFNAIEQLGLERERFDKRNYGKIIAEATNGARQCLFDIKNYGKERMENDKKYTDR